MAHTKKELTVGEFQAIAYLDFIFQFHLAPIFDTPSEDEEEVIGEEFKAELLEIYELISQAVTLKETGEKPKYWDVPISACEIALSPDTIEVMLDRMDDFLEKSRKDRDSYNDLEKSLIDILEGNDIETVKDTLICAYIPDTSKGV